MDTKTANKDVNESPETEVPTAASESAQKPAVVPKNHSAREALAAVSDGIVNGPPPKEVDLSDIEYFKLKSGRQDVALAAAEFESLKMETTAAGERFRTAQQLQMKKEKEFSDNKGLRVPITFYQLVEENETYKAVLVQRMPSPAGMQGRPQRPRG